jgi:hypothetical protein
MSRRFAIVLGICFLALGAIFLLPSAAGSPGSLWAGILFCITGVACLIPTDRDKTVPGNPMALVLVTALAVVLVALVAYKVAWLRSERRVAAVTRLLCKGIADYRQRNGHLPPSLDLIANGKPLDAAWLRTVTSTYSVTYDLGSSPQKRVPRLTVSAPLPGCSVQGPEFVFPP